MCRLLPRPPRCRYRTTALLLHPPSCSTRPTHHMVLQSTSFNDAKVHLNVIKIRMLEVRNLDLQSDGDACIDAQAQRYRCTDVKKQCADALCTYVSIWCAVESEHVFGECCFGVPWSCRRVVSAVESEHVCVRCCGVSSVRASGDVFAESVLVSGLTGNTWRVTQRVE